MKMFKFERWLYGVTMLFALVFITSDLSAVLQAGEQSHALSTDGRVGIARRGISSKAMTETRVVVATTVYTQLFGVFTSNHGVDSTVDPTVVPELANSDNMTYLYVGFRVSSATKVAIKWYVDNFSIPLNSETFDDPDEVAGTDLSPYYYYFAWFKADATLAALAAGNHTLKITVKPTSPNTGTLKSASCQFVTW